MLLVAIVLVIAVVFAAAEVAVALGALILALAPALARMGAEAPRILEALRRLVEGLSPVAQEFGMTVRPARAPANGQLILTFSAGDPGRVATASATVGPIRLENAPIALLSMLDDVVAVAGPLATAVVVDAMSTPTASNNV